MENMIATTCLPRRVVINGGELEIDRDGLMDLRLYVPPRFIDKVNEALMSVGYHKSIDGFLKRELTNNIHHYIMVNGDGTIESFVEYIDGAGGESPRLPVIFENYPNYMSAYGKLHILYDGAIIEEVKSLYLCGIHVDPQHPASIVCKEITNEPIYVLYAHFLTKISKL